MESVDLPKAKICPNLLESVSVPGSPDKKAKTNSKLTEKGNQDQGAAAVANKFSL